MKLLFKQRLFSWFDSYDIYDEAGNTVYVVKGQLSWGHKLVIYDAYGNEVGMVVQKVLTFLPKFEIYKNGSYIGCLSKEFSFLTPHYNIDYNGWHIDGTIMEWDYSILNQSGYSYRPPSCRPEYRSHHRPASFRQLPCCHYPPQSFPQ